MHEGVNNLYYS